MNGIVASIQKQHANRLRHRGVSAHIGFALAIVLVQSTIATQPPPPVLYELDISRSGGDEYCMFAVEPPIPTEWLVDSYNEVYSAGTELEVVFQTLCGTEYEFDHWQSNESSINGNTGNHLARFNIRKDTWIIAHFTPVMPKATGFAVINAELDPETAILRVDTTWTSSSGDLADLVGQKIFEVIANAPNKSYDSDIKEFLCTGLWASTEKYTYPEPWGSRFGEMAAITKMAGPANAEDGANTDYLMPLEGSIPQGCASSCSYTIDQWIVGVGSIHYLLQDKITIERGFEIYNGDWHYCINAHGVNACIEKTWP